MKTCKYCGGEIPDTAKKCKYCGSWLTSKQKQNDTTKENLSQNAKKKNNKSINMFLKIILYGFLIITIIISLNNIISQSV